MPATGRKAGVNGGLMRSRQSYIFGLKNGFYVATCLGFYFQPLHGEFVGEKQWKCEEPASVAGERKRGSSGGKREGERKERKQMRKREGKKERKKKNKMV